MKNNKTYQPKIDNIEKKWHVIDAEGQTLGRLATKIANILRGKDKAIYAPHVDTGDFVIVINASKIHTTGNKTNDKLYYRHTGYPGGLKTINLADLLIKHPERAITFAVKGMLPKNKLQQVYLKKMKVFPGQDHNHSAQKPEILEAV